MNTTGKYMTVEECVFYRKLAAKDDQSTLFAMSLPCVELPLQVSKRTLKKKRTTRGKKKLTR